MKKFIPRSEPPPGVLSVEFSASRMVWELEDGRTISVPLVWYPTLMLATAGERADFYIVHSAVSWPKLDYDLDSAGLLRGAKEAETFARKAWARHTRRHRREAAPAA